MVVALAKTYTPEDLLTMEDGWSYELVDGRLVPLPAWALTNYISGCVSGELFIYNRQHDAGWVLSNGASFQCFGHKPENVRKVNAAFISRDRLSMEQVRTQGHLRVVPDLVLEVISPNDVAYSVHHKIEEWLRVGVKVVWELNPGTKQVYIHCADGTIQKLGDKDQLTAKDVLPGFRCAIAGLFPGTAALT